MAESDTEKPFEPKSDYDIINAKMSLMPKATTSILSTSSASSGRSARSGTRCPQTKRRWRNFRTCIFRHVNEDGTEVATGETLASRAASKVSRLPKRELYAGGDGRHRLADRLNMHPEKGSPSSARRSTAQSSQQVPLWVLGQSGAHGQTGGRLARRRPSTRISRRSGSCKNTPRSPMC